MSCPGCIGPLRAGGCDECRQLLSAFVEFAAPTWATGELDLVHALEILTAVPTPLVACEPDENWERPALRFEVPRL